MLRAGSVIKCGMQSVWRQSFCWNSSPETPEDLLCGYGHINSKSVYHFHFIIFTESYEFIALFSKFLLWLTSTNMTSTNMKLISSVGQANFNLYTNYIFVYKLYICIYIFIVYIHYIFVYNLYTNKQKQWSLWLSSTTWLPAAQWSIQKN